jgi:putative peptidoglycan lipid II flippase
MTVSQILNTQTKTIAFAAGVLVLSSLVSRVLGVLRNGLLSWRFGAGETTDIYLTAFRIPDFLFGILIMGGIAVVFLPVFSEMFQKDEKQAWQFVSNVLNVLIVSLIILSALGFLFASFLTDIIAPGFSAEQKEITTDLTRLMLLSPILLGLSSVFSGMLQYFGKFLAYSFAPLLYNIGIIVGIIFLVPVFGIWGLGLGVVTGAFLHLVVQIPAAVASGFRWQPLFSWNDEALKKIRRLAFPRTIAATAFHINFIVMTAFASLISIGSITIFNYANDIQQFSIGLIGGSFAVAAFPTLSRFFAEKNTEQFQKAFGITFRQILFLVAPVTVLTFLLRAQIVRLIYGAGDLFTWNDTRLTAAALGIFAFGILVQAFIPFLTRTFFSLQNTKTPAIISVASIALNIVLAMVLLDVLAKQNMVSSFLITALRLEGIEDIRILALPLALVFAGVFQAKLLSLLLKKHVVAIFQKDLYVSVAKTMAASFVLAVVTYGILQTYGGVFELTTYKEVFGQFMLASIGGSIAYIMVSFAVKSPEMFSFAFLIRTRLTKRN